MFNRGEFCFLGNQLARVVSINKKTKEAVVDILDADGKIQYGVPLAGSRSGRTETKEFAGKFIKDAMEAIRKHFPLPK